MSDRVYDMPMIAADTLPRRAGLRLDILGGTLVVIIAAGPFRDLLILSGPGLMMVKATWVLLYAAAIFLLFRSVGIRRVQWAAVVGWSILLPVLIACLSPAWSIDPGISLRRAVSLVGCTLIGIYIGMRFSPQDFVRILFYSFVIIVAASVVVVVLMPEYGTMDFRVFNREPEAWKGLLSHKSGLGAIAGYGFVIAVAFAMGLGKARRLVWLLLAFLFFVVCLQSKMATSVIAIFAGAMSIAALVVMRQLRMPRFGGQVILTGCVVVGVGVTVLALDTLASSFNRDSDLTGRVDIWSDALRMTTARPWTGFGYQVVWGAGSATQLPEFWSTQTAGSAHNGYLNVATQIGAPAALIVTFSVLAGLYRAIRAYFAYPSASTRFLIGFFAAFLIINMMGSKLMAYEDVEWIVFIAAFFMVRRLTDAEEAKRLDMVPGAYVWANVPEAQPRSQMRKEFDR